MDIRVIGCKEGMWMDLAEDIVWVWAFVLAMLKLWPLQFSCNRHNLGIDHLGNLARIEKYFNKILIFKGQNFADVNP